MDGPTTAAPCKLLLIMTGQDLPLCREFFIIIFNRVFVAFSPGPGSDLI